MAILHRSEIIQPNDTVALAAKFAVDGVPVDLDFFPEVTIIQPGGGVAVGPTSMGVMHIGIGQYQFNYSVGLFPSVGTWRDAWKGVYQGFNMIGEYTFTTFQSQLPGLNTDGLKKLGDDPGYQFDQSSICNINNVLKSLRARLKSRGKARRMDENGNPIYKDCDVFTVDELVAFICQSLAMFNALPVFTLFTWNDTPIIEQFHDTLVQGALYLALGAQALIERGREFTINDNGIGFTPPQQSELLETQYAKEMDAWSVKATQQKKNMVPSPLGLGVSFVSVSPAIKRLRHLRARSVY